MGKLSILFSFLGWGLRVIYYSDIFENSRPPPWVLKILKLKLWIFWGVFNPPTHFGNFLMAKNCTVPTIRCLCVTVWWVTNVYIREVYASDIKSNERKSQQLLRDSDRKRMVIFEESKIHLSPDERTNPTWYRCLTLISLALGIFDMIDHVHFCLIFRGAAFWCSDIYFRGF